jgi:hypothetical protein
MLRIFILFTVLFSNLLSSAATENFRIANAKTLTEHVDRLFDAHNLSFATVICKSDAAQVMILGGKFDGKIFYFDSFDYCKDAKAKIHDLSKRCPVDLVVNTVSLKASLDLSKCK